MRTNMFVCLRHFRRYSARNFNCSSATKHHFSTAAPFALEIMKKVKSYGKLLVEVPWNVEIKCTDPHDYPDMDTLVVRIFPTIDSEKIENLLSVDVSDDRCTIIAKENVDARTHGDSDLSIASMVSTEINAESERGNISGEKLQANKIRFISSQGGSINLKKSLQGAISVETNENGSINAEKCLGTRLEMQTENGNIELGSNYCETATFRTVNGNLNLNNLHMESNIEINGKGSLNISCLDGSLRAKVGKGETKIHVVRLTGKTQVFSDGNCDLTVPRENNVQLSLRAKNFYIDESLNIKWSREDSRGNRQALESSGEIPFSVETSEIIKITGLSWAESLGLGQFKKKS